jgi:hypothetical protein
VPDSQRVNDLLAAGVQLIEQPPHTGVEPHHGAHHVLGHDPRPIAPRHVQQLMAQHGLARVE